MKHTVARILMAGGVASTVLFSGVASAIDWNVTGFVREEIAYSIAGNQNELNMMSDPFNDRVVPHMTNINFNAGNFGTLTTTYVADNNLPGFFAANPASIAAATAAGGFGGATIKTIAAGANTSSAVNCRYGHLNAIQAGATGFFGVGGFRGVLCPDNNGNLNQGTHLVGANVVPGTTAPAPGGFYGPGSQGFSAQGAQANDDINFNLFNTRAEVDIQAKINDQMAAYMKVRAYFDGTSAFTDGMIGNHYENPFWWNHSGQLAEWNSPNVVVDIPALYFDYNNGPMWVRIGNQTIAWGEAYFFRVMDVANGLDLRRHLTLGPGGEEFQDQRIASPGIRFSYTFNNGWEVDAFAQMFSPTILPATNTPYSVISHAATLDEGEEFNEAEGAINYGARLNMPITDQLTLMAMYTNRRDPAGVARYAEAPFYHTTSTVNGLEANRFCLGQNNDTNNLLTGLGLQGVRAGGGWQPMPAFAPGTKTADHCGSPLAPDPWAPNSTEYWRDVGRARLDPMKALRVVVDEWPADKWATRDMFGFGQEFNVADALRTIEGFHSSFGGFRAWVTREFKRENIFAVGGNYIINSDDPNSILDQLIVRGEVSVTPNKQFTDLGLSFNYPEHDDIVSALILEKYYRFSDAFPATYMVAQWMHRTASDLFGRDLAGTESHSLEEFIDPATGAFTPAALIDGAATPEGSSSADYVVFAFQQPFPNLVWRVDMSILVDVEGGYLVQPGVRYRPSAKWQWDLYANLIEDGGDENDDVLETIDFADEIFVRMTYFF